MDPKTFRFLNECASCRVHIGITVAAISIYMIIMISPRASLSHPAASVHASVVVTFFITSFGFDMICKIEDKMTKTVWLSRHDLGPHNITNMGGLVSINRAGST